VFDREAAASLVHDAHHVDAYLVEPDAMPVHPSHRERAQSAALGPADRFQRRAVAGPGTDLHLTDDEHAALCRHDVEHLIPVVPVAVKQPETGLSQVVGRGIECRTTIMR
jgi:hypothetical protein